MTPGKVLIVDDAAENLQVLGDLLEGAGYDLRVAGSGQQAIDAVRSDPPDIILLDVSMPGRFDGHEVCRVLKADPATSGIPIVFMTAYNDGADEAAGLELGAVDFVMKPFRLPVVLRRVANHLAYRRMQLTLEEQAASLEQTVAQRTEELERANERLTKLDATKTLYLQLLAHEVKAPAEGLVGIGELALMGVENEAKRERLRGLFRTQKERLDILFDQYERLVSWQQPVKNGRKRKSRPLRLDEILGQAWVPWAEVIRARGITPPAAPDGSLIVPADPALLRSALDGIVRWMVAAAPDGCALTARYEDGPKEVSVCWLVPGSWDELREGSLADLARDTGSDATAWLPLVEATVDALGGSVGIASLEDGLAVTLRLPAFLSR